MAEKFERTKPHLNVGTIGHVDHGKTNLTAAILHTLDLYKDEGYGARVEGVDKIVDAPEMIDLVETEIRELLNKYQFPGDKTPIIRGSGLKALEAKSKDDEWVKKVKELVDQLDAYIPDPKREVEKPFLMPVEDIFSIEGRGTVVTGRIERGVVKVNEEIEIVGLKP